MFLRWLSTHKSLALTLTSGTAIAALVTTIAVVSGGYTAQRLDLGDGTVWVANGEHSAVGRANTEVLELNSVVEALGSEIEVLQNTETVLVVDSAESTVDIVAPATSTVEETVALPPDESRVFLAGDRVVIFESGTGEVWITSTLELPSFDSAAPSTLSLGLDAVVSLSPAGTLVAFSPAAEQVYRVDVAVGDVVEATEPLALDSADQITSVGDAWAVLADGRVFLATGNVELGAAPDPQLQLPTDSGDRVLVGHSQGLIEVSLDGGEALAVANERSGTAARPFTFDGCDYAAWTDGNTWRHCGDAGAEALDLEQMSGSAQLGFASNGDRAVLNDRRTGEAWAVQRSGELIDNWDDLLVSDDEDEEEQQNDDTVPPEIDPVQQPPVAVDDEFGARPGRASGLPVLLNDYDPNGDVLVVTTVTALDPAIGRLDLITERQQVQLTLTPEATGVISFGYTIDDGRGGTATATVTVTVRSPEENSAPQQVRRTQALVQSGGRVTSQVLGDWVDPDGDAFYLTSAAVDAPDAVTSKPVGTIVYSDAGEGGDLKIVTLVVSDGVAQSSGSVAVSVRAANEVEIIADPFVVLAYAGQERTVTPLDHVRGGTGTIRLISVPAKAGVSITPSFEAGTFRFTSSEVRSHVLEYVVTDGAHTVTGIVRVDVLPLPDPNTTPITIPKTVFVQTLRNERVDVAGTDRDPAGGVLLVTGVSNIPSGSGVRAEILEQRLIRVSLDAPLDAPVVFNYRVTNGLAEAEGVITVIEIAPPERVQPPIANEDAVTVRVGQAIDVPVLANDEHPDGLELTLDPELAQDLPDDSGLLFASGRALRYLAPERTGNFTAEYRVTGPDGQAATALVRIAVREADLATNNPPTPATVIARVLAGETVRIPIPLGGIDPDGDSVQLLGQSSNPQKGSVLSVDDDTIVYQAGEYSAGTDSFAYTVSDALGARATGTVRVGIAPRLDGARNPVAIADEVTVRPGVTVSVQVLANDSDPDGSALSVLGAVPNDDVTTAEVDGDLVNVTPPPSPGQYGVIYTIENEFGGTSQNFIRVTVDPDAPLSYPIATDTVLSLSDVLGRTSVTVDILANVFFADGDSRTLGLSILPGYTDAASVTAAKRVVVQVRDASQIIPFRVAHPDDDSVVGYAFIRVPGLDDALPQLDRDAPALRVNSESQLVIDLNEHVIAIGDRRVQLTDRNTVLATHSDGSSLVRDDSTLLYRSADGYFGPASISFEVTDGASANDPNGRTAVLVLPIEVLPRENQPPVFSGAVLEFEPSQEKVIDLLKLTTYPYPDDLEELAYSVIGDDAVGFTHALNGSNLVLRADGDAVKGSTSSMTVGVRDDVSVGQPGRIQLTIVPSTRPLLSPAPDTAVAARGGTTEVDVLANDEATNPFPGEALQVLAIRGLDGAELPAGIRIEPNANRSRLSVTVAPTAQPVDVNLQYQVTDATRDADRAVWGSIRVSVQDRPDPVSNIEPTGFSDRSITLRWNAGAFNNSPITGYRATATSASGAVVSTEDCTGTTCTIDTAGNGSASAVRVSVVATNAIGTSDPVVLGDPVWSDVIPPAPTSLSSAPLDGGLRVSWSAVTTGSGGSPVQRYLVTVGSVVTSVGPDSCSGGTCTVDVVSPALSNGVGVEFRVSPRNDAYPALSVWNTSAPQIGTPAGPPIAGAAPLATRVSDSVVNLDWSGVFSGNGRDVTEYTAAAYTDTPPTCSRSGAVAGNGATLVASGTGTSAAFSGLTPNTTITLVVFAFNGQGCTASAPVIARTPPAVLAELTATGPAANGDGTWDFSLTGGTFQGGAALTGDYTLYYRINGGTEYGPVAPTTRLTADGLQYGQPLGVTARACRIYGGQELCQQTPYAASVFGTPVDARLGGVQFVPDGELLNGNGTFTWLSWPPGQYENVEYACGGAAGAPFQPADTTAPGSCYADTGLFGSAQLTVRVTANGGQLYEFVYPGQ